MMNPVPEINRAPSAEEKTIVELFRHNLWANLRLLDVCRGLSEEQLNTSVPGTYGSIHDTLIHLVGAEERYLSRLEGQQPQSSLQRGDKPDISRLVEHARHSGQGLINIAPSVRTTDTIQTTYQGQLVTLKAVTLLVQAINHATEHRAHVMTILTQLGIEPPELDSWAYYEELAASQQH